MKRFGEKLRYLREQQGLTLRQLADELEVSNGYISRMEMGHKIPNVTMVLKVADFFEADINQLLRDKLELDG